MLYLLYGTVEFLINREIKKIIQDNKIESIDINNYNLENDLLDNILDDASMNSLFSNKKLMIIENAYIFTGSAKKKGLNHNLDLLVKYLNNPNPDSIIIFTCVEEKIDDRKKIVKLIKDKGKVLEFNKLKNIDLFVKQELADYKMDLNTIKLFINYRWYD